MPLAKRRFALAALLLALGTQAGHATGSSFNTPGLWDPQQLDADVRASASVGATIAGARAAVNSGNSSSSTRQQSVSGVQQGCSLEIASATLPNSTAGGRTIVLQSEIHGSVIQVCR